MKTAAKQNESTVFHDHEENCYLFSPCISRQRIVKGKSYYVRRFFRGGQDFGKTMERLAANQVYKEAK